MVSLEQTLANDASVEPGFRLRKVSLVTSYAKMIFAETDSLTRTLRFLIRSVLYKTATKRWLSYIENHGVLALTPITFRRILGEKIHRPFARRGLSVSQRVTMLVSHYDCMSVAFSPTILSQIVSGERFELSQLKGRRETATYSIVISRNMFLSHQGELTLKFLNNELQQVLAQMIVNVTKDQFGGRIVMICGMQGPEPSQKADIIKATRDLFGLRPKRAVLEAVCALARWLEAQCIVATSMANHMSQTKRKWRRKVFADYDAFWRELNPVVVSTGDFEFPLTLPRRNLDQVVAKKRKDWINRCNLLDVISEEAGAALAKLGNVAVAKPLEKTSKAKDRRAASSAAQVKHPLFAWTESLEGGE